MRNHQTNKKVRAAMKTQARTFWIDDLTVVRLLFVFPNERDDELHNKRNSKTE